VHLPNMAFLGVELNNPLPPVQYTKEIQQGFIVFINVPPWFVPAGTVSGQLEPIWNASDATLVTLGITIRITLSAVQRMGTAKATTILHRSSKTGLTLATRPCHLVSMQHGLMQIYTLNPM
jgi:hypothetical protein